MSSLIRFGNQFVNLNKVTSIKVWEKQGTPYFYRMFLGGGSDRIIDWRCNSSEDPEKAWDHEFLQLHSALEKVPDAPISEKARIHLKAVSQEEKQAEEKKQKASSTSFSEQMEQKKKDDNFGWF